MSPSSKAAQLARAWIEGWSPGNSPHEIPLSADFSHSSPFGSIQGRDKYLERMKPMIDRGLPTLNILKTISEGHEATILYEMTGPAGALPCCDWVQTEGDEIVAVTSFYDATNLR